ncbi:AAA family ATPase [Spirillospora sp. NPDC000708]
MDRTERAADPREAGSGGTGAVRPGESSLLGRRAELTRALAAGGPDTGGPRGLLVLGEAGIGKSALLAAATEHLKRTGVLVLRAWGSEAESPYSFACLHQLLFPLFPRMDVLPEHLRATLETVFGMTPAMRPPDPMHLRVAVLTLLGDVSARQPVALVIDDAQHLDRDSADVLGFALRRLVGASVSILVAARGHADLHQVFTELPLLGLGPLGEQDAARLLDAQPLPPTGRARLELLRQARGNPLAIIELCRAAGRDRPGPGDGPAAGGSWTREVYAGRLRALPPATRRALLYAAAGEQEDLATVMRAAGYGSDLGVWRPAEEAGLIAVSADRVDFHHPLVRAAAYWQPAAQLRQEAHRDLAGALADAPERRAWHRAGACVGPDEPVAAALEDSAGQAGRGAGWGAAARTLQRAAELSPDPADRARRYARALHAADMAGDRTWVRELAARIVPLTRDPDLLGIAAGGSALALSLSARQREALRLLLTTLEHTPPADGRTRLALVSVLGAVAHQSGLPEARRPLRRLLRDVRIEPGASLLRSTMDDDACDAVSDAVLATADPAVAPALLRRPRRPDAPQPDDPAYAVRLLATGTVAWYADEPGLCADSLRQALDVLRPAGAEGAAANHLIPLAASLIDTGRWAEADAALEEAASIAAVHGLAHVEIDTAALRATLAGLRGRPFALPGSLWTAIDLDENRATHAHLLRAAAVQAEAAGDLDEAFRHLRGLFDENGTPLHHVLSARSIADLMAVARRTGRQQEIVPLLEAVRAGAGPDPTKRTGLLLHHAEALVDDSPRAERHFRLAVIDPAAQQWPLDRGRARLHYAQWLRRKRRPLDARPLLAAAADTFTRLGAHAAAGQATAELRASGVSSPHGPRASHGGGGVADPLGVLTAQQQQIVRLAAKGMSNREIARLLTLSPRTIGSHLYQAYPKLGVSNRHQLRDLVEG